ncbi:MAG: hypothetical protein MJZ23_01860 [Paludibacteraceae bacterium]|nr:hypothetical protein [Paludibacteraceae bacterium]
MTQHKRLIIFAAAALGLLLVMWKGLTQLKERPKTYTYEEFVELFPIYTDRVANSKKQPEELPADLCIDYLFVDAEKINFNREILIDDDASDIDSVAVKTSIYPVGRLERDSFRVFIYNHYTPETEAGVVKGIQKSYILTVNDKGEKLDRIEIGNDDNYRVFGYKGFYVESDECFYTLRFYSDHLEMYTTNIYIEKYKIGNDGLIVKESSNTLQETGTILQLVGQGNSYKVLKELVETYKQLKD